MKAEKKLLFGFGLFFLLIFSIGLIGIFHIQLLTKIVRDLGERNFAIEKVILEMKISNNLYAAGVRNYVFLRSLKYLEVTQSSNMDIRYIRSSAEDFERNIAAYSSKVVSAEQKGWIDNLEFLVKDVRVSGRELTLLAEEEDTPQRREKTDKLFVLFEKKISLIDEFLTDTLSKNNFQEIDASLKRASQNERAARRFLALSLFASFLLGAGIARYSYSGLKKERERRERLTRHLVNVEEIERENLSRQIHDQLSQDLSALKIYLGLIEKEISPETGDGLEKITKCKTLAQGLLDKSHNISELLRPLELDELGLAESIGALVTRYRELTGWNYFYHQPDKQLELSSEESLTLYRAAQESLTNIAKYSQAKNVTVSLGQAEHKVSLVITDDGVGFDYQELKNKHRRLIDRRLGILGLRERIELLGGAMSVESSSGKGTAITVELIK